MGYFLHPIPAAGCFTFSGYNRAEENSKLDYENGKWFQFHATQTGSEGRSRFKYWREQSPPPPPPPEKAGVELIMSARQPRIWTLNFTLKRRNRLPLDGCGTLKPFTLPFVVSSNLWVLHTQSCPFSTRAFTLNSMNSITFTTMPTSAPFPNTFSFHWQTF